MLSRRPVGDKDPAALAWARSGAMALTGFADGAPRAAPASAAVAMERAAQAFAATAARRGVQLALDGPALLGERAAASGLARRGRSSPGGATRLLRAADGWIALTLARPDDLAALPAWLELAPAACAAADPWTVVAAALAERPAAGAVERARLVGLPIALAAPPPRNPPAAVRVAARGPCGERGAAPPLVVDLSSLWAGPLCAQLLGLAGARVVKVESRTRPDGARRGPPAFFDLLHAGHESVVLDFTSVWDRAALRALVSAADVVIESARPRALRQLGIEAEELVATLPGVTWVAISGYGRDEPGADWVAFGDDAAAAGGLWALAGRGLDGPLACADAIADPLAGLHAAAAALAAHEAGGGVLLDVALARVAAAAASYAPPPEEDASLPVAPPRMRRPAARARPPGADTARVLAERDPRRLRPLRRFDRVPPPYPAPESPGPVPSRSKGPAT
ncbi:MAG: CoA transferase [Deltaproteobacteria bacterium]|nr:CoA transferase [Deltaproteobacteria bacterium]